MGLTGVIEKKKKKVRKRRQTVQSSQLTVVLDADRKAVSCNRNSGLTYNFRQKELQSG